VTPVTRPEAGASRVRTPGSDEQNPVQAPGVFDTEQSKRSVRRGTHDSTAITTHRYGNA